MVFYFWDYLNIKTPIGTAEKWSLIWGGLYSEVVTQWGFAVFTCYYRVSLISAVFPCLVTPQPVTGPRPNQLARLSYTHSVKVFIAATFPQYHACIYLHKLCTVYINNSLLLLLHEIIYKTQGDQEFFECDYWSCSGFHITVYRKITLLMACIHHVHIVHALNFF